MSHQQRISVSVQEGDNEEACEEGGEAGAGIEMRVEMRMVMRFGS